LKLESRQKKRGGGREKEFDPAQTEADLWGDVESELKGAFAEGKATGG